VSPKRNPLAAAMACDLDAFVNGAEQENAGLFVGQVLGRICYEAYHECPLCDCTAITRGPAHPMVICPNCGLEMMVSDKKDEE
jgi:hypothetical protein